MLWKTTIFKTQQKDELPSLLCTVCGHTSRIFRCLILTNSFATAGEDSLVNIWNFQGELVKKIVSNNGDSVWAMDYSENDKLLVAGNGDGSVVVINLNNSLNVDSFDSVCKEKVKRLAILNNNNLVFVTEEGSLYYFLTQEHELQLISRHNELKSYALLEISFCRKLVALAGFSGNIFIYKQIKNSLVLKYCFQSASKERIYSFHWLTCKLFLTCENEGNLKLWCLQEKNVVFVTKFILPQSKERWSTVSCLVSIKNIIVGDRRGNIHVFCLGELHAVQTIKRAHSHLGVTHLFAEKGDVYSMGNLIATIILTLIMFLLQDEMEF